jgi:alkylation response protein AidB-like acyl-CoA dehydrogenase
MSSTLDIPDNSIGNLLRETAARVFGGHCEPAVLRLAEQGTWPSAAWAALEEAGLHRALLPESAGGFDVPVADALSLLRVAAEYALPLPLAETMLASRLLADAGLPVPDGPLTIAPVTNGEPLTLRADRLHGVVSRIPWGRNAVALAALIESDGITRVALVQRHDWTDEPGENIAREPRDTLRFDGAPVSVGLIDASLTDIRAIGAALRSQQMAGALMRLSAMTTQYAQDRVQFGRPIGKFQAVQQNLAVLAGQTAAACAAADLAAEAVAAPGKLRVLPIAAAKARTGEAAGIGAAIAHQVHGAIGFTFEHSLHFLTRRLWSWRDEFGNETEWNRLAGRHMARAGADRLWSELTAA